MLLDIFDWYRQEFVGSYLRKGWREGYTWLDLAHVCRKWRAVMSGSAYRLDLGIFVGPKKPDHIETLGPWPIFIDYESTSSNITGSGHWRMLDILRHHDRVREIAFAGWFDDLDKFITMTNCPFPMLEGLHFYFMTGGEFKLPDTFLRGPDLSILHLRRLTLVDVTLASISRFLSSATALTKLELVLHIDSGFGPSQEMTLLTCLRGMPSLHRLDLSIIFKFSISPNLMRSITPQPSPRKEIGLLSKLNRFHYVGPCVLLDALLAGLSAPSLRDFDINLIHEIPAIVHLPRFINEIEEHYSAAQVALGERQSRLLLLTHVEYVSRGRPDFSFTRRSLPNESPEPIESIMRMSEVLFTRLVTVEELRVSLIAVWVDNIPWRRFLQRFTNLKVLRIGGAKHNCIAAIARSLLQDYEGPDDYLAFLPSLEVIEIEKSSIFEARRGPELAAFGPFLSARQKAGCPVSILWPIVGSVVGE